MDGQLDDVFSKFVEIRLFFPCAFVELRQVISNLRKFIFVILNCDILLNINPLRSRNQVIGELGGGDTAIHSEEKGEQKYEKGIFIFHNL